MSGRHLKGTTAVLFNTNRLASRLLGRSILAPAAHLIARGSTRWHLDSSSGRYPPIELLLNDRVPGDSQIFHDFPFTFRSWEKSLT